MGRVRAAKVRQGRRAKQQQEQEQERKVREEDEMEGLWTAETYTRSWLERHKERQDRKGETKR